jgi:hypothetical protein
VGAVERPGNITDSILELVGREASLAGIAEQKIIPIQIGG